MKRRGALLLILCLLLSLLAACGGSGGDTAASTAADSADAANGAGWTEGEAAQEAGGAADFSAVRQNAKLILSADLTLET